MRQIYLLALPFWSMACEAEEGIDNACSVVDNGDGTATITCPDGSTALIDNRVSADASCTIADNEDGSSTVTCDDGTALTVGPEAPCWVTNNPDGTSTIECTDGSTVTLGGDEPCTLLDNGDNTTTIDCAGTSFVVARVEVADPVSFGFTGQINTWVVPDGVTRIHIEAEGANGAAAPAADLTLWPAGRGAYVSTFVDVAAGETLSILVGQQGVTPKTDSWGCGATGGGGTFVVRDGSALAVAGGGGGVREVRPRQERSEAATPRSAKTAGSRAEAPVAPTVGRRRRVRGRRADRRRHAAGRWPVLCERWRRRHPRGRVPGERRLRRRSRGSLLGRRGWRRLLGRRRGQPQLRGRRWRRLLRRRRSVDAPRSRHPRQRKGHVHALLDPDQALRGPSFEESAGRASPSTPSRARVPLSFR